MKEIVIIPHGQMTNQMFQYLVALELQKSAPEAVITNYNLTEWNLIGPSKLGAHRGIPRITLARFDPEAAKDCIAQGKVRRLAIRCECANISAFPAREEVQSIFPPRGEPTYRPKDDDIVIHIRLGDILARGTHIGYRPLPLDFIANHRP